MLQLFAGLCNLASAQSPAAPRAVAASTTCCLPALRVSAAVTAAVATTAAGVVNVGRRALPGVDVFVCVIEFIFVIVIVIVVFVQLISFKVDVADVESFLVFVLGQQFFFVVVMLLMIMVMVMVMVMVMMMTGCQVGM
jgi:hypothetical protein